MPIYEYEACDTDTKCAYCGAGFEVMQRMADKRLATCPECGAPVTRRISAPALVSSQSDFDNKARGAGFHKLKRLGKGEYEKQY